MQNPFIRTVFGTVAGLMVAVFVVALIQMLSHAVFPPPDDLNTASTADMARMMEVIPFGAKAAVVAAWFLGTLAGASAANFIAQRAIPGWVVAGFILLASVYTTQMFPHPVWMVGGAVIVPVIAKLLADRLVPPLPDDEADAA